MSNNQDSGGTDNPEECAYWRGNPEEWDTDHEEGDVEVLLGDGVFAELDGVRGPFVDGRETSDEEADGNKEEGICEAKG